MKLCEILPINDVIGAEEISVVAMKNSFYHARLHICLFFAGKQFAHVILSRKKDYILKIIIDSSYQQSTNIKEIGPALQKNFPCKAKNFMAVYGTLTYSEQHPNDILKA